MPSNNIHERINAMIDTIMLNQAPTKDFTQQAKALERIIKKNELKNSKLNKSKISSEINTVIRTWKECGKVREDFNSVDAGVIYLTYAWKNDKENGKKALYEVFFDDFTSSNDIITKKLACVFTLRFMGLFDLSIYGHEKELRKKTEDDNIYIIKNISDLREIIKNDLLDCIYKYSRYNIPLLIIGETGTSKGLLAKAVHKMSTRRDSLYREINCAAFPENLLESELFGYKKGAFTGAIEDKKGIIEAVNDGTLLFDELGKMPYHLQVKLLKAIEDGIIYPLGSNEPVTIDVRFLATIQPGEAKELCPDLLYRFGWPRCIEMPTLGERLKVLNLKILESSLSRALETINTKDIILSRSAYKKLINRKSYPGNYRELENILLNAALSATAEERKEITPKDITFKDTINIEKSIQINDIKLKDIVAYADKEASTLCANIIQKKIDEIKEIKDIKNTLKSEGLTDNQYQSYNKQMDTRLKKRR